jgi:NAD(P)-dependent dehydrogenase (short-subunit alcohol dehydrogenase family)
MSSNHADKKHYPDVKLIDPQQRFSEFNYTFPPPSFPVLQKDFKNPPNCGEKSYEGRGRLQGLKALITGGDSGIGRAVAIAYAREGAKVTINYLPAEEPDAELLAQFLEREGILIDRIPGDLRDEAFCAKLVKQAVVSMGGLDILINNAGYSAPLDTEGSEPPYNYSTAELLQTFQTNVFAGFYLTRAAVPWMPRGGSIIFTASVIVTEPMPWGVDYGASKGAVTYMVRGMAQQLISQGIRVNGVAPGWTYTPILAAAGMTESAMEQNLQQAPYGRAAQPAELAPLYVALADPVQTYTSGEIFSCTGAMLGS